MIGRILKNVLIFKVWNIKTKIKKLTQRIENNSVTIDAIEYGKEARGQPSIKKLIINAKKSLFQLK